MTSIDINQADVDKITFLLKDVKNGAAKAMRTSINRTITGATTAAAKGIGGKVTLKAAKIKSLMKPTKATLSKLNGKITISPTDISLASFKTTPAAANFQLTTKGNGILIKVWKDQPSVRFRHAFFAILPRTPQPGETQEESEAKRHIGIFLRKIIGGTPVGRLPIIELRGPSISTVYLETPGLAKKVETTAGERLQKELDAQVKFLLGAK